ncbi:MAG: YceI family protein [Parahaliea sp.]
MILFKQSVAAAMLVLALMLPISPLSAASQSYTIDPTHTQVRMTWSHMGLSNPGATFEGVQGRILFDQEAPAKSSVAVTIPLSSLDSGVDDLDKELLGENFFDASRYPEITFKSTGIVFDGIGDSFTLQGDLSVHGVTRPVVLTGRLNGSGVHPLLKQPAIGFSASTRLLRSEFGVDAYIPLVSDLLEVDITVEAVATGE